MKEALTKRLMASQAISGQTAQDASECVFWGLRPEGSPLPAITIHTIDAAPEYTHDGPSDLQYPRFQFGCWGRTYGAAHALSRALLSELEEEHEEGDIVMEDGICVLDRDGDPGVVDGKVIHHITLDFILPWRRKVA